jgi:hypothetical protein
MNEINAQRKEVIKKYDDLINMLRSTIYKDNHAKIKPITFEDTMNLSERNVDKEILSDVNTKDNTCDICYEETELVRNCDVCKHPICFCCLLQIKSSACPYCRSTYRK